MEPSDQPRKGKEEAAIFADAGLTISRKFDAIIERLDKLESRLSAMENGVPQPGRKAEENASPRETSAPPGRTEEENACKADHQVYGKDRAEYRAGLRAERERMKDGRHDYPFPGCTEAELSDWWGEYRDEFDSDI
jgi:hypothetical protein